MKQYIALAAAVVLFSSCEKTIQVKTPKHESRIVINSSNLAEEVIVASIGKSVGVTEYSNKKSQMLTDATVVLSEDGKVVESLKYDPISELYISTTPARVGKTYTLKVSAAGLPDAEATAAVPQRVAINKVTILPNARNSTNLGTQDELRIEFTDPSAAGDYYVIRINPVFERPPGMPDSVSYSYYADECVTTIDQSVENVYGDPMDMNSCFSLNSLFIRDELFNGGNKELRLYVRSGMAQAYSINEFGDTLRPTIELRHITEAQYRYLKTARYAADNNGNPFAEPTSVYTNIKNGYGIFGIVNMDIKELR